jgi:hypothetical protein
VYTSFLRAATQQRSEAPQTRTLMSMVCCRDVGCFASSFSHIQTVSCWCWLFMNRKTRQQPTLRQQIMDAVHVMDVVPCRFCSPRITQVLMLHSCYLSFLFCSDTTGVSSSQAQVQLMRLDMVQQQGGL